MIKVMLFEDRNDYRQTLSEAIRATPCFELVGAYSTAWSVVKHIEHLQPDVVIMDIEMPNRESKLDSEAGIKAILEVKNKFATTRPKMIILSSFEDDERIFKAFCVGALDAYFIKSEPIPTILAGIQRIYGGEIFHSAYIARRIGALLGNPINRQNASKLSPRELEALTYLKQGYSQDQTATSMGIKSIRDLLKSIYKKLEVNSEKAAKNKVWYNSIAILRQLQDAISGR